MRPSRRACPRSDFSYRRHVVCIISGNDVALEQGDCLMYFIDFGSLRRAKALPDRYIPARFRSKDFRVRIVWHRIFVMLLFVAPFTLYAHAASRCQQAAVQAASRAKWSRTSPISVKRLPAFLSITSVTPIANKQFQPLSDVSDAIRPILLYRSYRGRIHFLGPVSGVQEIRTEDQRADRRNRGAEHSIAGCPIE